MKRVLVKGFGSIGKRHAKNLSDLGYTPIILTKHPQPSLNYETVSHWSEVRDVGKAIICSTTSEHISDTIDCKNIGVKNILIEKPLGFRLKDIKQLQNSINIADVSIAYNMRFLPCFTTIKEFIATKESSIRKVNISCGQYLPDWRTRQDYRSSYSAQANTGGGVHLDLSHEIDYMLWLFNEPDSFETFHEQLSDLEISSCDSFQGYYRYKTDNINFVVNVELDYFRDKTERFLKIDTEKNGQLLCDFIGKTITVTTPEKKVLTFADKVLFDFSESYKQELLAFLQEDEDKLTSFSEAETVLQLAGVTDV